MTLNLIDPQGIKVFLDSIADGDTKTAKLLNQALTKPLANREANLEAIRELPDDAPEWLKAKWPEGGPYVRFSPDPELHGQVQHVADWIRSAIQDQDAWLSRVDEGSKQKKPFRFNDIHTLEDAVREADKDMREKNRILASKLKLDYEGEKTIMEFDNGYRIVQMETPEALDRESVKMGHCIGQGSYDNRQASGSHRYLSLRDASNEPHATLEIENASNTIIQCQGKENTTPKPSYLKQVVEYARTAGCRVSANPRSSGLITVRGNIHSVYDLPENSEITGSLDLHDVKVSSLPEGLRVSGDLILNGTAISQLPRNLKVGGNLIYDKSSLKELPDGLEVSGDIYLRSSQITSIPDDIKVGGDLILWSSAINSLPKTLNVKGTIDLKNSQIMQLPDGFHCKGSMDLSRTRITRLPSNMRVDGDLCLQQSDIQAIPGDISILGDLNLTSTKIEQLPEGLRIGKDLNVSQCFNLKSLPENLEVGGSLDAFHTLIRRLPISFKVADSISLIGSSIESLPEGFRVNGSLELEDSSIRSLPENLFVGETLNLSRTSLRKLPEKMTVNGDLSLRETKIDYIPEGVIVAKGIILPDGTDIPGYRFNKWSPKSQRLANDRDAHPHQVDSTSSRWTQFVNGCLGGSRER